MSKMAGAEGGGRHPAAGGGTQAAGGTRGGGWICAPTSARQAHRGAGAARRLRAARAGGVSAACLGTGGGR